MNDVSRWFEVARRLRASQLGHRAVRRLRGSRSTTGPSPRWHGLAPLPPESRRPCEGPFDHRDSGGWRFAGRAWPSAEDADGLPDPEAIPPSLLSAYHAWYGDWIRGLAAAGRLDLARRAFERWMAHGLPPERAARHPYVRSRRILALVDARTAGLAGCEPTIEADARALETEVERDVRGNHLVADGAALYRAGCAFEGGPARRWRERGAAILAECARTQVLADGFHYERSPVYHGLVLEHFLVALESAAARAEAPPRGLDETARAMAERLKDLVLPDGTLLRWKDGAPGLALPHVALLAWAGRRAGPLAAVRRGVRAFPDAGLAVLETPDGRSAATLLAGPACPDELPAHGHADANAYEAVLDGVRVVASAGTADYAAGPERDRDRLPGAFAGVLVDGGASADPYGAFRLGARGWVRDLRWGRDGAVSWACATSDGFASTLGERIVHRRVLVLAPGPLLVCVDEWTGRGEHRVDLLLPLAPSCEAQSTADRATVRDARLGGRSWGLVAPGLALSTERGVLASGLGTTVDRAVLRASGRMALPARVVHAWAPDAPARRVVVTPVPGNALRVEVETSAASTSLVSFVPASRRP